MAPATTQALVRPEEMGFTLDQTSVRAARHWTVAVLRDGGLVDFADLVELLVSEIVTNAVLYAPVDSGAVRVCIIQLFSPQLVHVEVFDHCDGQPTVKPVSAEAEGGRGLQLVQRVSRCWGWENLGGQRHKVWFELDQDALEKAAA